MLEEIDGEADKVIDAVQIDQVNQQTSGKSIEEAREELIRTLAEDTPAIEDSGKRAILMQFSDI